MPYDCASRKTVCASGTDRPWLRAARGGVEEPETEAAEMCGIAGIWGADDPALVRRMTDAIAHRGPDGEGIHAQRNGALGHRRLAIMDPLGGAQPLYVETPGEAIVANGEIFNYPAIRDDLAARHAFVTGSDIEAVLHLYEERGAGIVRALGGMYALAICDPDHLFLARDPIGIKPLYFGHGRTADGSAVLAFASEMRALEGWVDDLAEFPPGTSYDSRTGFATYYEVPAGEPVERSLDDQVAAVRAGLEAAVASHLMSDVPVGAFLSGGLDSSVLAALARRHVDELHTFAVGIAGSRDLAAARRVAEHIGSVHHEHVITEEAVVEALPDVVASLESFDQDLVRSAIPTFFCSRLAAEHVKVILTGEGADELFAGYTYHAAIPDPATLHRELVRSVGALHNVNLQRVDRLTMRHGLEGRVPFLDTAFIELALSVPAELKLRREPGAPPVEKWILRKATEDLLPADIVWRRKEQFDEGSGTVDLLAEILPRLAAGVDIAAESAVAGLPLRSPEEALYHRLLRESVARPDLVLANVGRWSHGRVSPVAAMATATTEATTATASPAATPVP
ncbi:MAG TPA: asparagine synthase B [Candidatus Limnocylindrales bacterium]|nr:asparagine synthase B [Candidatus Limnocylindrales bacterium]